MRKMSRNLGTRMLEALLPQKAAAAGCATWCDYVPTSGSGAEAGQWAYKYCCYTGACNWVCSG